MTQSIADAVQTDGPILGETLSQEDVAARDRGMARRFTEGAEPVERRLSALGVATVRRRALGETPSFVCLWFRGNATKSTRTRP